MLESGFAYPTSEELMIWSKSSAMPSRRRSEGSLDVALLMRTNLAFLRHACNMPRTSKLTSPGDADQSATARSALASGKSLLSRSAIFRRHSSSEIFPVITRGSKSSENAAPGMAPSGSPVARSAFRCISGDQIRITPSKSVKITFVI